MQPQTAHWSVARLKQLVGRAKALATRAHTVRAAANSLPAVSSEARFDHKLAVARALERLGRVVSDLVGFQTVAFELDRCLQAAEAGKAFGLLSRELFGLRDGRAAGDIGDALIADVTALLADAKVLLPDTSPASRRLAA